MNISLDDTLRKYDEYLLKQYEKGLLSDSQIEYLRRKNLIDKEITNFIKDAEKKSDEADNKIKLYAFSEELEKYKDVKIEQWLPEDVINHSDEFYNWINSFLFGAFTLKIDYLPFTLYKAQAYHWLKDTDSIYDYDNKSDRTDFKYREYNRCSQNTLYFASKYGLLKEGDSVSGDVSIKPYEHQALVWYLADCGYSLFIGKGRQIGLTSALGMYGIKKMIFQPNFYIKFIATDEDTTEEIFTDKIKYPFGELPLWLRPLVRSDSNRRFWLSDKKKKGERGYPNSRLDIIIPKVTAINGGSPQCVLLDEVDSIDIFSEMLNEARPTLFWRNPKTHKLEFKRQIIAWSSGIYRSSGSTSFEKEWNKLIELWAEKNYSLGFVPIFLSWHCRMSKEEYEKEKLWYYGARASAENIDRDASKIQFHQHYPSSPRDMFLKTSRTLISREIIDYGIDNCRKLADKLPVYGYFEPLYDYSVRMHENSDVPYKIIGAKFIPVDESEIEKASAVIVSYPEKGWKYRYWQGTDPIATETGHSKLASTIWDDVIKAPVCLVNIRRQHNHKWCFLQSVLAGLFYDTVGQGGIKELVEGNIGTNYIDYKRDKGFGSSLVFNSQLPDKLVGGCETGIDNHGTYGANNRAAAIIDYMAEFFRTYYKNIFISTYFEQLQTFTNVITKSGKETWQPASKIAHFDDALFSATYAYICRLSFNHLQPTQDNPATVHTKVKFILTRDENNRLIRVPSKQKEIIANYETV